MQRFFDILFSSIALACLSPLLIPIVVLLKLTGEGEIIFPQLRIGRNGKNFKLFKFATMLKDSPNIGNGTVTLHNDPRILPMGHFLRKTKINELPQLVNILKGDMSIIGPRPQAKRSFDAFSQDAKKAIHSVRPGLSGVGSIVFRNEEGMMHSNQNPNEFYDHVVMPYKGNLEIWFSKNNSVINYFLLIFLTIIVLFSSNSKLLWYIFKDLPKAPDKLKEWI